MDTIFRLSIKLCNVACLYAIRWVFYAIEWLDYENYAEEEFIYGLFMK